jgi:hypothetical protein
LALKVSLETKTPKEDRRGTFISKLEKEKRKAMVLLIISIAGIIFFSILLGIALQSINNF